MSTHPGISDSVSACEEGQQLLECSGGKGDSVSCGKSCLWGKVLRAPDCVMLELGKEREEGKEEPRTSSLCILDSSGFMILGWLCQPGLVTAVSGGEVKSTENMF